MSSKKVTAVALAASLLASLLFVEHRNPIEIAGMLVADQLLGNGTRPLASCGSVVRRSPKRNARSVSYRL